MNLIFVVVILLILFGGGFGWHTLNYQGGPYLGGGIGLLLIVVLILALSGRV